MRFNWTVVARGGSVPSARSDRVNQIVESRELLSPDPGKGLCHLRGDETVDPRRDNGQRERAELEHGIVESADVEFRSERLLRLFAGAHDRELAHIIREGLPKGRARVRSFSHPIA